MQRKEYCRTLSHCQVTTKVGKSHVLETLSVPVSLFATGDHLSCVAADFLTHVKNRGYWTLDIGHSLWNAVPACAETLIVIN